MSIQHANRGIVKKDLQLYYNREYIKSFRGEATTNIAYATNNNLNSNNDDDDNNDDNNYEPIPEKKELSERKERKEIKDINEIQQPPMIMPNNNYNYTYNTNYEDKPIRTVPIKKTQRNPEYSFWDRMVLSKNDVIKLVVFSLIIVLGISIEKLLFFYVNQYLTENLLSPMQDFLVRLSIPVSVILFLWIIKSL